MDILVCGCLLAHKYESAMCVMHISQLIFDKEVGMVADFLEKTLKTISKTQRTDSRVDTLLPNAKLFPCFIIAHGAFLKRYLGYLNVY
jgi:hypothetical protein